MAGRSNSEESDAFDDVTPAKPVSVDDLDYDGTGDMPTRTQSSDEIAAYQQKAREKREAAFRSFRPPTERTSSPSSNSSPDLMGAPPSGTDSGARKLPPDVADAGSGSMPRPIPRESGPVRIDRLRAPEPEVDLEKALEAVAASLEKLPSAPRVPQFEQIPEITSLEPEGPPEKRSQIGIAIFALVAMAVFVGLTFFR